LHIVSKSRRDGIKLGDGAIGGTDGDPVIDG
jgi:hypothetical protein